ncbi:hypothetical protein PhaeoP128_01938 [Phaeobacter gallaeciensis]|nr:hypothetical protein PhaeoP129_01938 [Phaeobacter gallaeciensis]ATF22673.1 hypothetical protein PhaeoP128_01938 [Phaeobacter gallaeciensis]
MTHGCDWRADQPISIRLIQERPICSCRLLFPESGRLKAQGDPTLRQAQDRQTARFAFPWLAPATPATDSDTIVSSKPDMVGCQTQTQMQAVASAVACVAMIQDDRFH